MKVKTKADEDEEVTLAKLNEIFRDAMLQRLLKCMEDGKGGWDNKRMERYEGGLKERIIKNAIEEDWLDEKILLCLRGILKSISERRK